MSDLRALSRREHQLRNSMDEIDKFVINFQAERDTRQGGVRLDALESIFEKFVQTREKIELLLEDANGEEEDEEAALKEETTLAKEQENDLLMQFFENHYYALKADLLALQSLKPSMRSGPGDHQTDGQATTHYARAGKNW